MGDSLEISGNNAVNGVNIDGDKQSMNGDDDHCMSGDIPVLKRMDDYGKVNDADTGDEDESMPPHITASPMFDNVDHLEHEVDSDDVTSITSIEPDLSHSLRKMDDSEDRRDDVAGVNDAPLLLPMTASPSVGDKHEDYLNQEVRSECDDNSASVNSESDPSHYPGKMELDNSGVGNGAVAEPMPLRNTTSPSVDDKHTDDLILGLENGIDTGDASCDVFCVNEPDLTNSVSDKHQPNVVSDIRCEQDEPETSSEHCLMNQASDTDFIVTADNSYVEMPNSAIGDGNVECQSNTVQDEASSSQKSAWSATRDTESAISDAEEPSSIMAAKSNDIHRTDESCAVVGAQLQPEREGSEAKTESGDTKNVQTDDGRAADREPDRSSAVSTSQVSASDAVTSAAESVSTRTAVVIGSSLLPSLSVLPARVAVLPAIPSVASSTAVPKLARQSSKPLAASVAASTGSGTRVMSKILQDVGLLLASQRVFKNLVSLQKKKVGNSEAKDDKEMLQKLKTSHQKLVAKNHSVLIAQRKCWCGFRSESANVLEEHRNLCRFQGRCCYCRGLYVYKRPKMMMTHLWKVHRKVGRFSDSIASIQCGFCPLNFSSHFQSMRHMADCRRKFFLGTNLAPRDNDKDIPVFALIKQPSQVPVMVASAQKSPITAPQVSSRTVTMPPITVSPATSASPGIIPPVALQLAPVPRNLGPAAPLVQIGNQLFTLLPTTSVAVSSVALNQSSAKSISKVTVNLAAQTVPNAITALPNAVLPNIALPNTALPIRVENRSTSQAANLATRMPATSIAQPVRQYSMPYTVCHVCNAIVKDKAALLVHMHIVHRWDGSTHKVCQYCSSPDVTFPSVNELQLHIAKFHQAQCWICRSQFQPPDRLVHHLAERHRVTMFKMLQLRRCYVCASVPPLPTCALFEDHMTQVHAAQFADTGKLWDHIRLSPDADKNWYAKCNADGTLECPMCEGQFISAAFLYRHVHLEHSGTFVKLGNCHVCGKCVPSNLLLVHLIAAHTQKCSVVLSEMDVSDDECVSLPPVGTKRLKNRRGERVSSGLPVKRFKAAAEAVVISDEDDSKSDSKAYVDHSSDEDFVTSARVSAQPANRLRRSIHTRMDRRNSSADDVRELLESIVDSGESETVSKRSASFKNMSISQASACAVLCNGITEDEVEIIESIVPNIRDRPQQRQQLANKPPLAKSSDRNYTATASTADGKRTVDFHEAGDRSKIELNDTEGRRDSSCQSSTESKSGSVESSAQQLMAREQIMMNSVEEVLEIDGETVLIVHDDEDDDDD